MHHCILLSLLAPGMSYYRSHESYYWFQYVMSSFNLTLSSLSVNTRTIFMIRKALTRSSRPNTTSNTMFTASQSGPAEGSNKIDTRGTLSYAFQRHESFKLSPIASISISELADATGTDSKQYRIPKFYQQWSLEPTRTRESGGEETPRSRDSPNV